MPASYPTAVKTWTALVDGADYPQADDLNTVYDEITAIEGGIRNGSAPLNSSASTLASLSVGGGSTLASLQVTNSTFSADLTFSSGYGVVCGPSRQLAAFPEGIRVYNAFQSSNSTVANLTVQADASFSSAYGIACGGTRIVAFHPEGFRLNGTIDLNSSASTAAPSSGGGATLPASPKGYVEVKIAGSTARIAYY